MTYGGNTPKYYIPYPVLGDVIDPGEESKQAKIIDNQIYGAIRAHSRGHGVIREGTYSSVASGAGFNVYLSEVKTQNMPSLEAFINQVYIYTCSPVIWGDLTAGTYYLFGRLVETTDLSSLQDGDVSAYSSASATVPEDGLLLASVVISGSSVTIDSSPTDKVRIPSVIDHINDSTDPHGTPLRQTELITSGMSVLGDMLVVNDLQVNNDIRVTGSIIADDATFDDLTVTGTLTAQTATIGTLTVTSGATFNAQSTLNKPLIVSSGVSIDGRDVSADGLVLDAHIANVANPHAVTAAQVSALPLSGGYMTGPITMASGISIDGVDPSVLQPLYDGSNADALHTHTTTSGASYTAYTGASPEFGDAVVSGNSSGTFSSTVNEGYNAYLWESSGDTPLNRKVVLRTIVPYDHQSWSTFSIWNKVSSVSAHIDVTMKDTAGADVTLVSGTDIKNTSWTETVMTVSGVDSYTWTNGSFYTVMFDIVGAAGVNAYLGDFKSTYTGA